MRYLWIDKINNDANAVMDYLSLEQGEIAYSDDMIQKIQEHLLVKNVKDLLTKFPLRLYYLIDEKEKAFAFSWDPIEDKRSQTVCLTQDDSFYFSLKEWIHDLSLGKMIYLEPDDKLDWFQRESLEIEKMVVKCRDKVLELLDKGNIDQAKQQLLTLLHSVDQGLPLLRLFYSVLKKDDSNQLEFSKKILWRLTPVSSNIKISVYREEIRMQYDELLRTLLMSEEYGFHHSSLLYVCCTFDVLDKSRRGEIREHLFSLGYSLFYEKVMEQFIKTVLARIQVYLDLHRKVEAGDSFLITNCYASEICSEKNIRALAELLHTVNHKEYQENQIDGIRIPCYASQEMQKGKLTRIRFQGNENRNTKDTEDNQEEDVTRFRELLQQNNIDINCQIDWINEDLYDFLR